MADNIEKLKQLVSLLHDSLTKEDFVKAFELVMKQIKDLQQRNLEEFNQINTFIGNLSKKLEDKSDVSLSSIKKEADNRFNSLKTQLEKDFSAKVSAIDKRLSEISDGIDGKDADENAIIERLKEEIKVPTIEEIKNDLPVMADQVRDALELLQGDDRLDVSAIRGLDELLEKNVKVVGGGGGFSSLAMNLRLVDDEIPTNSGDNINFTIQRTASPATSLKVYRGGSRQRLGVDYTYANRTITLSTALNTGEELLCDYRI